MRTHFKSRWPDFRDHWLTAISCCSSSTECLFLNQQLPSCHYLSHSGWVLEGGDMKPKRHFLCLRKDYNLVGCTDPLATNWNKAGYKYRCLHPLKSSGDVEGGIVEVDGKSLLVIQEAFNLGCKWIASKKIKSSSFNIDAWKRIP